MTDNSVLIIASVVMGAVGQMLVPFLFQLWRPSKTAPNPLLVIFVYWPAASLVIWAILWIAYRLYFNAYP